MSAYSDAQQNNESTRNAQQYKDLNSDHSPFFI